MKHPVKTKLRLPSYSLVGKNGAFQGKTTDNHVFLVWPPQTEMGQVEVATSSKLLCLTEKCIQEKVIIQTCRSCAPDPDTDISCNEADMTS